MACSKNQAEQKELVFLVGAEQADLASCEKLLESMGKKVVHVGAPGMGNALKLVFNLLLGISMGGFAEAMGLGEALGIDRQMLLDALIGSPVAPPYLASKKDKFERSHYEPEFPLRWMQKDLQMVAIAGYENKVPLPLANATKEVYQQAVTQGWEQQDFSAIYAFWQSRSQNQNFDRGRRSTASAGHSPDARRASDSEAGESLQALSSNDDWRRFSVAPFIRRRTVDKT